MDSILGHGNNAGQARTTAACVAGTIAYRGNRVGSLSSKYNETFENYLTTLSGRLRAKVNLLLIGAEGRVDYVSRIARSSLSTSYNQHFIAELGSAILENRTLTATGVLAASQDPSGKRTLCGDSFVYEVGLGGELLISARFQLSTADELKRFVATVDATTLFGLVSATKTWTSEMSSFATSGYVIVDAFQRGGDPQALQSILNSGTSVCRFDNVDLCRQLLRDLMQYAGSTSSTGFEAQLANQAQWAAMDWRTARYEDSGHDVLAVAPQDDSNIKATVRQLTEDLVQQTFLKDRVTFLLNHVFAAPEHLTHRNQLNTVLDNINANIAGIQGALSTCWAAASESECELARQNENATRVAINESDLQF